MLSKSESPYLCYLSVVMVKNKDKSNWFSFREIQSIMGGDNVVTLREALLAEGEGLLVILCLYLGSREWAGSGSRLQGPTRHTSSVSFPPLCSESYSSASCSNSGTFWEPCVQTSACGGTSHSNQKVTKFPIVSWNIKLLFFSSFGYSLISIKEHRETGVCLWAEHDIRRMTVVDIVSTCATCCSGSRTVAVVPVWGWPQQVRPCSCRKVSLCTCWPVFGQLKEGSQTQSNN